MKTLPRHPRASGTRHGTGSQSRPSTRPVPATQFGKAHGRHGHLRVMAVAATETKQDTTPPQTNGASASAVPPTSVPPMTTPPIPNEEAASMVAAKINAMASKINAARELARRLSEEKQAAAMKNGGSGEAVRNAEEASAAAAAQAARADALARALRKAESTRDQLQRLKAENEALRELLIELAADKAMAKSRLSQVADAAYAAVIRTSQPPRPMIPLIETAPSPPASTSPPAPAPAAAAVPAVAPEPTVDVGKTLFPDSLGPPAAYVQAATAATAPAVTAPVEEVQEEEVAPAPSPEPVTAVSLSPPPTDDQEAETTIAAEAVAAVTEELETEVAPFPVVEEVVVEQPPAAPAEAHAVEVVESPVAPPPTSMFSIGAIRPARPSNVQDRIKASIPQLQQLASMAANAGQRMFTLPPQPVAIDGPVRLFYNRAKGPLPGNSAVMMKLGFNKWDILSDVPMAPVDGLPRNSDQHWFECTVDLPAEIFRMDFVFYDKTSQQYDNNQSKDYKLELAGAPTEQQLLEMRLQAYQTFEAQRIAYLESENARLWRQVELVALEAAGQARIKFREAREQMLREEAEALVRQRRKVELSGLPVRDVERGVYAWTVPPVAGKKAYLAYNKGRGPLSSTDGLRVHLGYDGWWNQIKQVYDMYPMSEDEIQKANLRSGVDGNHNWYGCWVDVPHSGSVLDFVMSDRNQAAWDNNAYQDYHTRVGGAHTIEQLTDILYQALKKESEQKDQEAEDRDARHAYNRVTARGEALRKRRASVNEFLYTVPYVPVPGQKVEVFYNPEHTPLRGRPSIYMRCGFNRWSWNPGNGVLSIKMEPTLTAGIGFYHASVEVPADAWGLDMVFIDTDDSAQATGFYDNNGGLDYHVPIKAASDGALTRTGGSTVQQPMKVVHIAVEMAPIAKVGGMGDVVTALGRAVQEEGHLVEVVIPKYDCINYDLVENLRQEGSFFHANTTVRVWRGLVEGLPTTFLEPENGHFWRGCIYGRNDDAVRFGFHCGAALAYMTAYNVKPTVLHCHDWQTAPIAWGNRGAARCVFTIHNLSYGADLVGRAMAACEVATTVSPTYASEVSGHGAVAPHLGKLYGIRNGIDVDVWNPADDKFLPKPYGPDDAVEGKEAARRELRTRLGLSQIDVPIVSCVTRLVAQKGIHLIKHAAWRTLERGGQFVLLGSAPDGRVQADFNNLRDQLKMQYHDRAALVFTYDEPLSHLIYAGSDIFLVPSMFEPCGLTQMIAMQYGTVPVVRKTGGLADTVFDIDHDEDRARAAGMDTNGFVFEGVDAGGIDYALNRAMAMWYSDRPGWRHLVQRVMRQDWSWYSPALDYIELYYKAMRS